MRGMILQNQGGQLLTSKGRSEVSAHCKRRMGNLAPCGVDKIAAIVHNRLKSVQRHPGLLDGCIAETGLGVLDLSRRSHPDNSVLVADSITTTLSGLSAPASVSKPLTCGEQIDLDIGTP